MPRWAPKDSIFTLSAEEPEREDKSKGPAEDELTESRAAMIEAIRDDCALYWWGKDPETGDPLIRTLDAEDKENPIKVLPDWPAHRHFLHRLETQDRIAVEKVRQIMFSWFVILWLDWQCRFHQYRFCAFSKSTKDEAKAVLKKRWDRVIEPHLPAWLRQHNKAKWTETEGVITYTGTNSSIITVGENVEERGSRGDQWNCFVVDEAACHPQLKELIAAAHPMSSQIIMITTPQHGQPGATYFENIIREERETV